MALAKSLRGGGDALVAAEGQAKRQRYGNLRPSLFDELQKRKPTDFITITCRLSE